MSEFCTSVAIMERGRMVVHGTIAEVQARFNQGVELHIKVLERAAELRNWLLNYEGVVAAERNGSANDLTVKFAGTDEQSIANLLANIFRAEFRMVSFAPRQEGLEELFLKVGAKEVS
jgi:ABC-2 type transport system ATP-binding protein